MLQHGFRPSCPSHTGLAGNSDATSPAGGRRQIANLIVGARLPGAVRRFKAIQLHSGMLFVCWPQCLHLEPVHCVFPCLISGNGSSCGDMKREQPPMTEEVMRKNSFLCSSHFSWRYTCYSPPECENCTGLNWCSEEAWMQDDANLS